MNRQALVGLFTLVGLGALFAMFLVIANFGTGGRYPIAVHFRSAAGLHRGALVLESGVNVGVVTETRLLDDFTVEVILGINNAVDIPRDSRFVITQPITGDVTLEIVPPPPLPAPTGIIGRTPPPVHVALLPREILPLEQQPQGANPATLTDLLELGQSEARRLDRMLSLLEDAEPRLLSTLQTTLDNANDLTTSGRQRAFALMDKLDTLTATLQLAATTGGNNIVDLTNTLNQTAHRSSAQLDTFLGNLNKTSVALNQTVEAAREMATDPRVKQNLLDTTQGLATTATEIGQITTDIHKITGDPQTQAQLKNTVSNIDASTQKLNSLLHQLGGTSNVPGVDFGATPYPIGSPLPAAVGTPAADAIPDANPTVSPSLQSRLNSAVRNLLAIQIRLTELDAQKPGTLSANQLGQSQGPQTDFNLVVLPNGKTSLVAGASAIGTKQSSANFALEQTVAKNLRIGGGVLYSNLGFLAQYNPGVLGIETRIYNPAFPTLDVYGNVNVNKSVQLFAGERDILHNGRRTAFGLQLQF